MAEQETQLHVDGSCLGNPGPMGIGLVILDEKGRREASEYLGLGTNNVAELTAILRGLQLIKRDRRVVVYSDSGYAIGVLSLGWKAKVNQGLITEIRMLMREFPSVRFIKVPGHAGFPDNERCDALARQAAAEKHVGGFTWH